MRPTFLVPLFATTLLAAQLAALPAFTKRVDTSPQYSTTGEAGCNFKCEKCVWNFPSGGSPGRCVPNAWGVLTCQPYPGSPMTRNCGYHRVP
jgi:hypothetical protein